MKNNPVQTEITLQSPIKIQEIEISNSLGQTVLKTEKNKNISTISLPKGVYFVKILLEVGLS